MKTLEDFQGRQAPDLPMRATTSRGNFLANAMWCPERKLVQALAIQETSSCFKLTSAKARSQIYKICKIEIPTGAIGGSTCTEQICKCMGS